jgi:hypothetical protein
MRGTRAVYDPPVTESEDWVAASGSGRYTRCEAATVPAETPAGVVDGGRCVDGRPDMASLR